MTEALMGLIGIFLGIGITEFLRRKSRIEYYSQAVFENRLAVYQQLYEKVRTAVSNISEIIEKENITGKEKYDEIFMEGLEVLKFTDEKHFFLNEEIAVHLGGTFLRIVEIAETTDEDKRSEIRKSYNKDLSMAYDMIKKESGIQDINRHFSKMTKIKHTSPLIEYYRALKKEYKQ